MVDPPGVVFGVERAPGRRIIRVDDRPWVDPFDYLGKCRPLRYSYERDCIAAPPTGKLHNLTALVRDVRRDGVGTMGRFNAEPAQILWYHREIIAGLRGRAECPQDLVTQLELEVAALATLLGLADRVAG